ncbi:MAG: class I SAM-dependent methyltransferase [Epsilonproteobacteria bacterium]|nr:class I SAM-dependent methyltransferase [Campylobacterota bacterium]
MDIFANRSKSWDMKSRRVQGAKRIATAIADRIDLSREMSIADFGAGTGLLSLFLSDRVGRITAIDNSPSMLEVLRDKIGEFNCPIEILNMDITKSKIDDLKFDGIVSSMTLHHIDDIPNIFRLFYKMLDRDGFIAIADLDMEDGTFHSDNSGVFHFGFERDYLNRISQEVGFKVINFETVNRINKANGEFPIFLMTAFK